MNDITTTLQSTKGRFFTLRTKQGEMLNAQYRGETPKYVRIFDRNNKRTRLFAKTSVCA